MISYIGQGNHKSLGPSNGSIRPALLLTFCLVFGIGTGVIADRWILRTFVPSNATLDFRLITQAWNIIQRKYVDHAAANPKTLTYGAIGGMVDALGDTGHSVFLSPEMVKQVSLTESGKLKGVGVEIRMKDQHVVIVSPIDNSPAQRAGLRSGEIIINVNHRDIAGMPLYQVVKRITGPVGTSVELTVLDPQTHRLRDVTLIRATIRLQNVTWQQLPGTKIADVRLARFSDDTAKALRKALQEIQQQGLRGMILDLRNNPGGELVEAVAVASQFLTKGNVLLVRNAKGKITPMPVKPGGVAPSIPMAVLVNGGTASASEIVAAALKDAHRAVLVGETTFGTGTVLQEFPLANGSALLLAIQEWLTPDGHSYWHKGITPELKVTLAPDVYPLVPATEKRMTAAQLQSSNDKQLLRALQWVTEKIGDAKTAERSAKSTTIAAHLLFGRRT